MLVLCWYNIFGLFYKNIFWLGGHFHPQALNASKALRPTAHTSSFGAFFSCHPPPFTSHHRGLRPNSKPLQWAVAWPWRTFLSTGERMADEWRIWTAGVSSLYSPEPGEHDVCKQRKGMREQSTGQRVDSDGTKLRWSSVVRRAWILGLAETGWHDHIALSRTRWWF